MGTFIYVLDLGFLSAVTKTKVGQVMRGSTCYLNIKACLIVSVKRANALSNIFTFACFTFVTLLTAPRNLNIFSGDMSRYDEMMTDIYLYIYYINVCLFSGQHDNK